ncbi:IS3 family transposase, partial [Xanthomonas hortorum]|uniref:IS3 family transposase n=1 Tax=Xanthomonas hortorum TaxID=56454 RepID=UPI001F164BB1
EATVKRFHYDDHAQLQQHLANFIDAYNYGRRLKALKGLTPYEHRLTKIKHPWTNGQVEWMNRTIKEATVKRFHYDDHAQLQQH